MTEANKIDVYTITGTIEFTKIVRTPEELNIKDDLTEQISNEFPMLVKDLFAPKFDQFNIADIKVFRTNETMPEPKMNCNGDCCEIDIS